jgi:hypothetical protein
MTATGSGRAAGDLAVLSPHLDAAAFSMGCTIPDRTERRSGGEQVAWVGPES